MSAAVIAICRKRLIQAFRVEDAGVDVLRGVPGSAPSDLVTEPAPLIAHCFTVGKN